MTVIAACKLRNGCVLAVDGRVTADDSVVSDNTPKFVVLGQCLVAFAGDLGPAQQQAQHWQKKQCATLGELKATRLKARVDWLCLIYDRSSHRLVTLCSDGCVVEHKNGFATLGSGEHVAWGFLAASRRPLTFTSARATLHKTLQATSAKVTSCGGRVTFLTARGRKRSVEFHTARC